MLYVIKIKVLEDVYDFKLQNYFMFAFVKALFFVFSFHPSFSLYCNLQHYRQLQTMKFVISFAEFLVKVLFVKLQMKQLLYCSVMPRIRCTSPINEIISNHFIGSSKFTGGPRCTDIFILFQIIPNFCTQNYRLFRKRQTKDRHWWINVLLQ